MMTDTSTMTIKELKRELKEYHGISIDQFRERSELVDALQNTRDEKRRQIANMKIGDLKRELKGYGVSTDRFLEKTEFVEALLRASSEGYKTAKKPAATASQQQRAPAHSASAAYSASYPAKDENHSRPNATRGDSTDPLAGKVIIRTYIYLSYKQIFPAYHVAICNLYPFPLQMAKKCRFRAREAACTPFDVKDQATTAAALPGGFKTIKVVGPASISISFLSAGPASLLMSF